MAHRVITAGTTVYVADCQGFIVTGTLNGLSPALTEAKVYMFS